MAVRDWFAKHKPNVVVLAAAKVGGIQANKNFLAVSCENLRLKQRY